MTDKRDTELTAQTGTSVDVADQLYIVDVSDTTMDATGTSKKITWAEFINALGNTASFETTVRANSLDQMATPAADVAWGSHKITGLANGTSSGDAVNFGQLSESIYGDGSDGAVVFDGSTTILGLVPSANAYALNRDIYCTNVTINTGVVVSTVGFRIFCTGTLTGPGTIASGNALKAGGSFSAGTAGQGGTNVIDEGQNGGTGATGASAASAARTNCYGGRGGSGGNGTGNAGTTAGTVTAPAANLGTIRNAPMAVAGLLVSASGLTPVAVLGGTGGASGGGDSTNKGGAGGASGGVLIVVAQYIASTNAININANGGNGESPAAGNVGGGGGGGGGLLILISKQTANATCAANGGTHGTGHGSGTNGTDGSSGTIVKIAG